MIRIRLSGMFNKGNKKLFPLLSSDKVAPNIKGIKACATSIAVRAVEKIKILTQRARHWVKPRGHGLLN
jgi:hypothetical protein